MLNGVVTRINRFISGLNDALSLLPDWAVGEGGVQVGTLNPVNLGRINNPFAGAAESAGAAAADAFSTALSRTYLEAPDLGLSGRADEARARADGYREAAGMLSDAASRPLAAWDQLRSVLSQTGRQAETAMSEAATATDAFEQELDEAAGAAGGAGSAASAAGDAAAQAADRAAESTQAAASGWQAVSA